MYSTAGVRCILDCQYDILSYFVIEFILKDDLGNAFTGLIHDHDGLT
jgi:hypothetical protein